MLPALQRDYQGTEGVPPEIIDNKVKIFVRRGGPNYKEGLRQMKELGQSFGVPIEVYGPEAHMTKIVKLALKGGTKMKTTAKSPITYL